MNFTRSCLFALVATGITTAAVAEPYLESRKVTRADLYTGTPGAATVSHVSLVDWLNLRREQGPLEDTTIANRGFIVDDEAVLAELYDISNRLLANWPGNVPQIAIFLKSGGSTMYGGEATRSNEILIEVGTLAHLKSHDELAAVLSHELSHILLGHNLKLNYLDTAKKMFQGYNDVKSFTRNMQAIQVDTANAQINTVLDQDYYRDMARINDQQQLATRFYKGVHSSLFSRGDEVDADMLAVDLLVRAGYSPLGLKDSFEGLRQSYNLNEKLSLTLMETSNQLMGKYATEVDEYMTANGIGQGLLTGFTDFMGGAFEKMKDVTREVMMKHVLERLEASHPVPEDRVAKFVEYLNTEYGRKERNRKSNSELLTAYRNQTAVQSLMVSNELGMDVLQYLAFGDGEKAQSAMKDLDAKAGEISEFYNWVSYKVYSSAGSNDQASRSILGLNSVLPIPTANTVELSDYLLDQSATDATGRIDSFIAEREGYFGTVPEFYPAKIRLASLAGNTEQAQALGRECIAKYGKDEELKAECTLYAGIASPEPNGIGGSMLRGFGLGR